MLYRTVTDLTMYAASSLVWMFLQYNFYVHP